MCKRKGRKSVLGKSVLFLIAILSFSGSVMVSEASDVAVAATTGTGGNSAVVSETGTEQTESETESEKKSETEAETEAVKNGWVKDTASGKTYYYKNGQKVTGKTKIEGKYYYFSKNGVMKTGLVTIDSKTYYFKPSNGVMVQSKWITFTSGRSYFDAKGVRVTGLKKINGKYYYFNSKGIRKTGLVTIDSKTYYFNPSNGVMVQSKWITFSSGRSYFNSKGVRVTGRKKINGKYYYFNSKGIRKSGLVTIDSKTYYFRPSNGVMVQSKWITFSSGKSYFNAKGVRATGLTKINGKYYYFNSKGILKTGTVKDGKNTYYADSKGVLSNWKIGSTYYDSKGKEMDSVAVKEFTTYLRAVSIAESITTSSMSKSQKLKVCFDWVMSKYYATMTVGFNYPGWTADHANDHFLYGKGNCFADACALAYLAKAIGYTEVYVCSDSLGKGAHGWCEIDGKVYDPLFAQAKSYSKYYGASYSTYYIQTPALHEKI